MGRGFRPFFIYKFRTMVEATPGAVLYVVEVAFGDRAFTATEPDNPRHLQLRSQDVLWLKERALNLLERRLPPDWKYLAWIDADVKFVREDWVNETLQQLQLADVAQMWSEAIDLDYDFQVLARHQSFVASYRQGVPQPKTFAGGYYAPATTVPPQLPYHPWHPGFAWAWRRQAWEDVGGLLDIAILGAGDNHMAKSLIGDGGVSSHPQISDGYREEVLAWQTRACRLQRNLSLVKGTVEHFWHGPKEARAYWTRWQILVEEGYDPHRDLEIDPATGLYRLRASAWKLRDRIRAYFESRDEDSPK